MTKDELQRLLNRGYNDALKKGPPWVMVAWANYLKLPVIERIKVPFLYHVLGMGTPEFKAPPKLAFYMKETPFEGYVCDLAYEKVGKRGRYICSQIRGPIGLGAWCVIPHLRPKETGWPELTNEQIEALADMA